MPDGSTWAVLRRHEMARILTRRDNGDRRLYLLFFGADGAFRRGEIVEDFPDPATAPVAEIIAVWHSAEVVG